MHRPGPARDRGRHELRETVGGGAVVRGHEARLGAQGRLAALASGTDALVTILAAGYALSQMLAYADPARVPGLADPAPWRPPGTRTAGLIQAGMARLLRGVGLAALITAIPPAFRPYSQYRSLCDPNG